MRDSAGIRPHSRFRTGLRPGRLFPVVIAVAAAAMSLSPATDIGASTASRGSATRRCAGVPVTVSLARGETPTPGDDVIQGTARPETINGGGGNDRVCGDGGNDVINGGPGTDRLFGDGGSDRINGGTGSDRITGGGGQDRLFGQRGADIIDGNTGRDLLDGGPDRDTLRGGPQRDICRGGTQRDTAAGCEVRDSVNIVRPPPPGIRFSVVGDSVTSVSQDEIMARGGEVLAFGGVDIPLGRPALRRLAGLGRRNVVIALGLMDVSRDTSADVLRRRVRSVLRDDVAGVRCVIWVDLKPTSNSHANWPARAGEFNALLREIAAEYGRPVAPWSGLAAAHPGWFRSDGVHPNLTGQRRYARFLSNRVASLC